MLIAAADAGGLLSRILSAEGGAATQSEPPNPILPTGWETFWAFVCFMALFLIMRYVVYPKLAAGMQARARAITEAHEQAERLRRDAHAEVEEYELALAGIRSEAVAVLDDARQTLDVERQARIGEVNARIAQRRAEAAAEADATRAALADQIAGAAAEVTAAAASKVLGRSVALDAARTAVDETMRAGVR